MPLESAGVWFDDGPASRRAPALLRGGQGASDAYPFEATRSDKTPPGALVVFSSTAARCREPNQRRSRPSINGIVYPYPEDQVSGWEGEATQPGRLLRRIIPPADVYPLTFGFAAERQDLPWDGTNTQAARKALSQGRGDVSFVIPAGTVVRLDGWDSVSVRPAVPPARRIGPQLPAPASMVDVHVLAFGWDCPPVLGRPSRRLPLQAHTTEPDNTAKHEHFAALYGQGLSVRRSSRVVLSVQVVQDVAPIEDAAQALVWWGTSFAPVRTGQRRTGTVTGGAPSPVPITTSPVVVSGPFAWEVLDVWFGGLEQGDILDG